MAHSQSAVAYAAADPDQLYIGVGVGNVYFTLLIAASGKEGRRRKPRKASCRTWPGRRRIPTRSCSAIPVSTNCSGSSLAKGVRDALPLESLHSTTISLSFLSFFYQYVTDHLFVRDLSHGSAPPFSLPGPCGSAPVPLLRELCGASWPCSPSQKNPCP